MARPLAMRMTDTYNSWWARLEDSGELRGGVLTEVITTKGSPL
jgi:hypothetical protein